MASVLFCPECPECGSPTMQVQYVDGRYQPHCQKCIWPMKTLPERFGPWSHVKLLHDSSESRDGKK